MARRILNSIQLDKIAAVDRPCQEHAVVAILKRALDGSDADVSTAVEDALMDKRVEELEKRILLAKTGVALLSTLLIKEFDESKHPRAEDGKFGTGGGSAAGGSKGKTEGTKSKPKRRVLRVLRFLTNVQKWSAGLSAVVFSGLAGAGIIATGAIAPAAPLLVGAAAGVLGYKVWDMAAKALTRKIEKMNGPRIAAVKSALSNMPREEVQSFGERFVDQMSDEDADKVAAKLEEIAAKVKDKSGVKKNWSDEARSASAEARRRGLKHRGEATKHKIEGRTILALKHDMVADHYEEAAAHYAAGRKQRAHDVRRQGESILGITKASEIKKAAEKRQKPIPSVNKFAEMIAKSSIMLAALPDPVDHVRKVIGNTAADYIHDFVNSTNSRFEGKSKKERIRQALGAYYSNNK
jgi:hypothetical protein